MKICFGNGTIGSHFTFLTFCGGCALASSGVEGVELFCGAVECCNDVTGAVLCCGGGHNEAVVTRLFKVV